MKSHGLAQAKKIADAQLMPIQSLFQISSVIVSILRIQEHMDLELHLLPECSSQEKTSHFQLLKDSDNESNSIHHAVSGNFSAHFVGIILW